MNDIINLGVDAKHSNEDQIAPFSEWIEKYSERIGLFGGFDLNLLVLEKPDTVFNTVLEKSYPVSQKCNWGTEPVQGIPSQGIFRLMATLQ